MPTTPTPLQTDAREAYNKATGDFRRNQSSQNWTALELAMLALQQSNSKFTSGHDLSREALRQLGLGWHARKSAQELIDASNKDPEAFNSMNAAALAK